MNFIDTHTHFVETQEDCDAIGVDEDEFVEEFTIYPNPTTGITSLNFQEPNDNYQIKLYDVLGRDVSTAIGASDRQLTTVIDISNLPQGIYYLTIKSDKQPIDYARGRTQKIIKL